MTEWRIHIVPKLQPRDQTFVLMGGKVADYTIGTGTLQTVVIDWYGKDMASAKWILQLASGDSFTPPGPPPRDSTFRLIHESSQRVLVFPVWYEKVVPTAGEIVKQMFVLDHFPWEDAPDIKHQPARRPMVLTGSNVSDDEYSLIRFDPLASPYLAINDNRRERVLDVAGGLTDPATPVLAWPWNGGDNQQWKLEFV